MDHIDLVAVVLPAYMSAYVGRFLRGVFAVGAAESRQLPTFELHVRIEVVLAAEDARTLWARKLALRLDLQARWHLEAAQVYQMYICKKMFGTCQSSQGRWVAVYRQQKETLREQEKSQPSIMKCSGNINRAD